MDQDMPAHYSEKCFEITSQGIALKTIREEGCSLRCAWPESGIGKIDTTEQRETTEE